MRKEVISQRNPKSPVAELFRTLRTNIQFMNSKKDLKTILVTSTMPGTGKSWVTANLATTFAQAGKKVVIVDADMRKGRQHVIFNVEKTMGLSNYLSGIDENGRLEALNITQYIKPTEASNLFLITAGNVPPNPSELLASETTEQMIEKLKGIFDIIIFDGTPCLLVADALILSRVVDTTILVTGYNETKKDDLIKIKKDIENVGGKIAGVIMNKMPINPKKYENSYYYGSSKKISPQREEYIDLSQEETNKYVLDKDENVSKEKTEEIMNSLNQYLKEHKGT